MLGPAQSRDLDRLIVTSLDRLVPSDHFSRHLDQRLYLGFVREWARDAYADRGRPSIDPVVFVKRYLMMFFEGVRSERQLLALAATRSKQGRLFSRSFSTDDLERFRGYRGTAAYEQALRKRVVWVEPLFAEAKQ